MVRSIHPSAVFQPVDPGDLRSRQLAQDLSESEGQPEPIEKRRRARLFPRRNGKRVREYRGARQSVESASRESAATQRPCSDLLRAGARRYGVGHRKPRQSVGGGRKIPACEGGAPLMENRNRSIGRRLVTDSEIGGVRKIPELIGRLFQTVRELNESFPD